MVSNVLSSALGTRVVTHTCDIAVAVPLLKVVRQRNHVLLLFSGIEVLGDFTWNT